MTRVQNKDAGVCRSCPMRFSCGKDCALIKKFLGIDDKNGEEKQRNDR